MTQRKAESVEHQSAHPLDYRIEQLKRLFPEVVNEDGIDGDALRNLLGLKFPQKERYNFTWAGKQDALLSLQQRSHAALKPVPEESLNWESTGHAFVEGDNLEVLKLLYKSYFGRVKMIYIDPPYNTGNDFIYPDDFSDPLGQYLRVTGQVDEAGHALTSKLDLSGRKHSGWLSMMYPRLFLARQLLSDDGVIFISIDDNEVHNIRFMMNEIFGEENFVGQIAVLTNPKGRGLKTNFARSHEYLLVYTRSLESVQLSVPKKLNEIIANYPNEDEGGRYRLLELRNTHREYGRHNRKALWYPLYVNPLDNSVSIQNAEGYLEVYPIWDDGFQGCWTWKSSKSDIEGHLLEGHLIENKWKIFRKNYAYTSTGDAVRKKLKTLWVHRSFHTESGQQSFDTLFPEAKKLMRAPKPIAIIQSCIELSSRDSDIILDFFAGSGTTAQAVLELNREDGGNRKFVLVQLPQPIEHADFPTIAEIGKERIRRVIARMQAEESGKLDGFAGRPDEDLGFRVFRLDRSAMRQWEPLPPEGTTPEEYAHQLNFLISDPLLDGWTVPDIIAEVALKEAGFGLNYTVERVAEVTGQQVWRVTDAERDQRFYICLDDHISLDALRPLALGRDDLFVFRDSAVTDTVVANLALTCRIKSI